MKATPALLDTVPIIAFLYDRRLRLVDCNRHHLEIFGVTGGIYAPDYFNPPDRDRMIDGCWHVLSGGNIESTGRLMIGSLVQAYYFSLRHVEISGSPHMAGVGLRMACPCANLTQTSEALRLSLRMLNDSQLAHVHEQVEALSLAAGTQLVFPFPA